MSDENRMDFAKRMQQFFDHYMLGDPMPVWMAKGIPAVDKGKEFGFEYVEEESPTADPKEVKKALQFGNEHAFGCAERKIQHQRTQVLYERVP